MSSATLPRRQGLFSRRWLVGGIILIVLVAAFIVLTNGQRAPAATTVSTVPVTRGNIISTVNGNGTVAAEQMLDLVFQTGGNITEVMVKEGDRVSKGQALARLDDRALQLQVANAQAGLSAAQTRLDQLRRGNIKPEDITAAQAQLASAQASYDKVAAGPAAADIAAAQAAVKSAQAAFDAAVRSAGSSSSQIESAKAARDKAQLALQQAQSAYDKVAWMPDIGIRPETKALQNATIDFQQAQANYETLASTAETDAQSKVQSARAQLEQAKANLDKLAVNRNDLAVAQAGVDQAKANLDKLTATATQSDLSIQQSSVAQAEQNLKQAQLNLENAVLRAPFASVVTAVNIVPGSTVNSATPAVRLLDRSTLHVDLKLNENDIVKVQLDQPVTLVIDSLSGWKEQGKVSYIAPAAENTSGIVTYGIRVSFGDEDPRVKVGMSANINILTAEKDGVLLVPNSALLPKGSGRVVQVPGANGTPPREVDVQTGLTDGLNTEITGGLQEGEQIIALPTSGIVRPQSGIFGN
ncbi:MAG: efflux RND transporter periplasmic adaptor subunit [Chloroflexi bacterium]|nr:efflux RND transporter periplasmic adaptor subunit [Chloroflexota bacterium]